MPSKSLETHAEAFRHALEPRAPGAEQETAWREARRNYRDVDELRAALRAGDGQTNAFFAQLALVEPSPRQYETLVRSLLVSKVGYGGRVRLPPNDTLHVQDIRRRTAQGVGRLLKLSSLGSKSGEGSSIDVEMLLAPIEAGGGGMPDVRAELLAEIAVDTITMLHSPRAAVREAALPTGEGRREMLATLHAETGFTMHVHRA